MRVAEDEVLRRSVRLGVEGVVVCGGRGEAWGWLQGGCIRSELVGHQGATRKG